MPHAITIRRAEPGDFEALTRQFEDPSAYSGTLQLPYPSRELWRQRLAEPVDGEFVLLACVGEELVGNAGLHHPSKQLRRSHAMGVGMAVPSQWQGKGVGTALLGALVDIADNWLNVFRLELTVYVENERAIALYRKFGFEIEGTHKAYALRDGRYVDAHFMARIRAKPAVE
jgi:L-phenylalanine/L-methionine N-acetyltransferase